MSLSAFYFGVWREPGHHLRTPNGGSCYGRNFPANFPVSEHALDGALLPPQMPEVEGRATLIHINGWTILAFWDRSGDQRGKSNSAFIIEGTLAFDEMLERAKYHFPHIWARIKFDVVLYQPS